MNHAQRGRLGGLTNAARNDTRLTTAKARSSFLGKFEREVDPDGRLTPEERTRRARAAKSPYFSRIALKRHRKAAA